MKFRVFFVWVSINVEKKNPLTVEKRYENQIRINHLIEENKRKRDEYMNMF